MNGFVKDNAIIPLVPNEDHAGKEGYAVKVSSEKAALLTAVTDVPIGVIAEGGATTGKSTVAIGTGGFKGTIRVKLGGTPGTVATGTLLQVTATGTFIADAGTGARVLAAQALEAGAANELIEAVLFKPVSFAS